MTEYGVAWNGIGRPMEAVSLKAAIAAAATINEITSDGNLAYPVRREVTDWELVYD